MYRQSKFLDVAYIEMIVLYLKVFGFNQWESPKMFAYGMGRSDHAASHSYETTRKILQTFDR